MRLVVTDSAEGRSHILSSEQVRSEDWVDLWTFSSAAPLGSAARNSSPDLPRLNPGEGRWCIVAVPPAAKMRQALASGIPGLDEEGFHLTDTIDFVVILDGPISLKLDDETTELEAGDLVVQRNTNHAWWNYGERPVRLLVAMMGIGQ